MPRPISIFTSGIAAILFLTSCQTSQVDCFTPASLFPIAFTPDNTKLVINADWAGVQIFDLETMKETSFFKAPGNLLSMSLSPDGQTLAWLLEDGTIQLVQTSDGKPLKIKTIDDADQLEFSPKGDKLFIISNIGSVDGLVNIWDIDQNKVEVIETGREVLDIAISADETRLATVPFDGPVELWDLPGRKKVTAIGGTGGDDMSNVAFSTDGKYLAASLPTGKYLWNLSDKKLLWEEDEYGTLAFSPDGRFFAHSKTGALTVSSPNGSQIIHTWEGMQWAVWGLTFSPDSSMLAVAVDDTEIRIWRVEDGKLLYIGKESCP